MFKSKRKTGWAVVFALLALLMVHTIVFADGDVPEAAQPEAATEGESEGCADAPPALPPAAIEDAGEDGQPNADAPASPAEPEATNPEDEALEMAAGDEAVGEDGLLDSAEDVDAVVPIPEADELIVADGSGQPLDMASQASADTLAGGDPWWISGGVKYAVVFNGQFCPLGTTVEAGTCWKVDEKAITTALEKIDTLNLLPSDGMLFVENGDYSEGPLMVDGLSGNMVLQNLRGILGAGSSMTNLTGSLTIKNTMAGFTLQGFNIHGGVTFENNTGNLVIEDVYITNDNGDGLVVENQNGSVELKSVQSRNSKGDGGRIDNSASPNANVSITNSAFDYNDDGLDDVWNSGLKITTNGKVTLEGVAASRNNGNGAEVYGFSLLTINNSLFDRNNPFPYPEGVAFGYGLYAESTKVANVQINNVFAYFNGNNGIEVHTPGAIQMDYVRGSHSSIRFGKIDPAGETVFERLSEDNKFSGDRWYFTGAANQELDISLSSFVFDTYLELFDASDDSLLAFNDDLNGTTTNSQIDYTLPADGLYYLVARILESTGGVDGKYILSINDPGMAHTSDYNLKGALLDNTTGNRFVKVNNAMFQDNTGDGLVIHSLNLITLTSIDTSHNSMRGALLDNCQYDELTAACLGNGKISVTSPSSAGWYGGNYFLDNGLAGLEVHTRGALELANVGAYDNLGAGMDLHNEYGTSAVTINTNVTNFTNVFRNNGEDGLRITSMGAIKVESSEANYNLGHGYYLTTRNSVRLKDLTGSSNGKSGLTVNNQVEGSSGTVSLIASKNVRNTFKENGASDQGQYAGVDIRSFGNITVLNTDAWLNYAAGAHLTNKEAPKPKNIYLTDCETSENQGSGLLAYAQGSISVKGLVSSGNSLTGSDIVYDGETVYERLTGSRAYDNWWFTAPPGGHAQIILQSKEFNAYLELYDVGGNLIASDDNGHEDNDAQIEIDLPGEGAYYIHVRSSDLNKGNYSLSINDPDHDYETFFHFYGALLDNEDGSGSITLNPTSLTPFNEFNDNTYRGLEVKTKGKIFANNLNAVNNGDTGAYLFNANGLGSITVYTRDRSKLGAFDSNSSWGIYAISSKTISLKNISATLNGDAGAYLNNCLPSNNVCLGSGGINLTSAYGLVNTFSSNQKFGLWMSTSGNANINDLHANANGLGGLYVKNSYDGASGGITLKASKNVTNTFLTNVWASPSYLAGPFDPQFYGVELSSNGTVAIKNISVQTTYGTGARIQNQVAVSPKNLTIQEGSFEANQGYGLVIYSMGSVSLYGVNARYNSLVSGAIDMYGETVFEHLTPNTDSDIWWFDGYENDPVDIILTSEEFDVILEVFDKENRLIAADDDSYGGANARLTFDLPADGEYYIKVRPNGGGDGNYELSLNDEFMNWVEPYEYAGVHVDNRFGSGGVIIKGSKANESPSYYHNNFNGLTIKSAGAVTLSNVYALQNGADGASISNHAGTSSVTVNTSSRKLTSSFSYNTHYGLSVQSRGKVVIKNSGRMYLRDNGYTGAYVDNTAAFFAPDVEISRVEVNNNIMKGLEIYSSGDVTLSNILAIHNLENGVFVDNCDWDDVNEVCKGSGNVMMKGSMGANTISDNGASGLAIYSNGNIVVDRLNAIQNVGRGMVLSNEGGVGYIFITNTIARLNEWHGIHVITSGAVTVRGVHSMSNGLGTDGDGIYLRAATPARMIFQQSSFLGNEGSGIDIAYDSWGVPTINNVSFFGNDTDMDGDLNKYIHPF